MSIQPTSDTSPFDSIRQCHPDGSESWDGRDLMPLLGYEKWERFESAIRAAMGTLAAGGHDVERNASHYWEASGKTERANYRLSRFACYLVAMECDGRKAEVAAAKTYFAVKTREAEVSPVSEMSDDELMLKALTVATKRVEALTARAKLAEQQVEEARPAVDYMDKYVSSDDACTVKVWAGQYGLTEPKARALLIDKGIIKRHHIGKRWSSSDGRMVDEYEYRATAGRVTFEYFTLRPQHNAPRHHNGQVRQTLYVRQQYAIELAIRAGLVDRKGLRAIDGGVA